MRNRKFMQNQQEKSDVQNNKVKCGVGLIAQCPSFSILCTEDIQKVGKKIHN